MLTKGKHHIFFLTQTSSSPFVLCLHWPLARCFKFQSILSSLSTDANNKGVFYMPSLFDSFFFFLASLFLIHDQILKWIWRSFSCLKPLVHPHTGFLLTVQIFSGPCGCVRMCLFNISQLLLLVLLYLLGWDSLHLHQCY